MPPLPTAISSLRALLRDAGPNGVVSVEAVERALVDVAALVDAANIQVQFMCVEHGHNPLTSPLGLAIDKVSGQ